jgi:four helix bundle protein
MNLENKKIQKFTDLYAWKEAHILVLDIYKITKTFPRDEIYGLISQMRRAAVSITSNIAEGFSRRSFKDKAHFYTIALGSLTELENQIYISKDVGYLHLTVTQGLISQLLIAQKLINGLISKTNSKIK